MTIDKKRLKIDAAYWDAVAPKGAKYYLGATGIFVEEVLTPSNSRIIPRPIKPAAPEWEGWGIPPVGKEVEYEALHDWWAVKITAVGEKHILMNYGGVEICRCIQDSRFRPIRTKEQQEREALRKALDAIVYADSPDNEKMMIEKAKKLLDSLELKP